MALSVLSGSAASVADMTWIHLGASVKGEGQQLLGCDAYVLVCGALALLALSALVGLVARQPAGQRRIWPGPKSVELCLLVGLLSLGTLVLHALALRLCDGGCMSGP